jgi:nucleoside-diphosphate-sugar epimerase
MSSCHALAAHSEEMLTEATQPNPTSIYGESKLEAEHALKAELAASNCAWTILRPPLVYGLGNRANFESLIQLVCSGIPLPFAGIRNRRSFIYVGNLANLIAAVAGNQAAFNRVFFPSDDADLSTPDLVGKLAVALGRPARMFSVPASFFKILAALPGGEQVTKLTSSLWVDCGSLQRDLGWGPRFTMEEGLSSLRGGEARRLESRPLRRV